MIAPLNINDWLTKAEHDLESAQVLFDQTENYDIVVYHAHQAVEKTMKWFLLKNECRFPFVHDLILLYELCAPFLDKSINIGDIGVLNKLLPNTRYPLGDWIERDQAFQTLQIANMVCGQLRKIQP